MNLLNHSLAATLAFVLAFWSIGAIVTVPTAQTAAPAVLALPVIS